jgi:hypothetical protein
MAVIVQITVPPTISQIMSFNHTGKSSMTLYLSWDFASRQKNCRTPILDTCYPATGYLIRMIVEAGKWGLDEKDTMQLVEFKNPVEGRDEMIRRARGGLPNG